MLSINDGHFKVEVGLESPTQTINQPWNSVVLEGLRLIDENKSLSTPIPKQLFANLSNIKNVENVFVLDFNGEIIEGKVQDDGYSVFLTFLWYKQKKILNQFYSDSFHYIQVRQTDGYLFIFENGPNLIVIKTNFKVIVPVFKVSVRKILSQIKYN
jgi:predicted regulator of Ras-like GTPase activity (Roadblock/LC7/MglB family)